MFMATIPVSSELFSGPASSCKNGIYSIIPDLCGLWEIFLDPEMAELNTVDATLIRPAETMAMVIL